MLHHFVNRKSREDRKHLWLGAMASQGVAMEDTRHQVACDKDDYPDATSVCESAMTEFPEFFSAHLQSPQRHIGYGHLLCSWSVMRMWQCVAESDFWAGAWLDDYALRIKEHEVREAVRILRPEILMLAWHHRDDIFVTNEYHLPYLFEPPADFPVERKHRGFYRGAGGGSDWANILSPRAAGWLLQWMADKPCFNTEIAIPAFAYATGQSGIYSVRANDPAEHGQVQLKRNQWVVQLSPYTEGRSSDLVGLHQ